MKCLIYKRAEVFSSIVFFENEKGSSVQLWGLGTFGKFSLWTNIL